MAPPCRAFIDDADGKEPPPYAAIRVCAQGRRHACRHQPFRYFFAPAQEDFDLIVYFIVFIVSSMPLLRQAAAT